MTSPCEVEGCPTPRRARGLCGMHYQRLKAGKDLSTPPRVQTVPGALCRVDGCSESQRKRAMCLRHYTAASRHGGDPTIRKIGEWGEGHITTSGYRVIYAPGHPSATKNGYMPEHRFLMSEHIGRPLRPDEDVHHINGQRLDNRIENLELWVKTPRQPRGARVEDVLAWAKEVVERYG